MSQVSKLNRYFVFEGPNGSGKSTLIQAVAHMLQEWGYTVVTTTEPSSLPVGKFLRSQFGSTLEDITMLQLFLADRVEHQKCIRKILGDTESTIVLSDRGDLSTYVFQYLLPQDYLPNQDLLKKMVKTFSDNAPITVPKTYFIVMARVDTIRKRLASRGLPQDRWESNTVLDRVNYFYQYLKYYADSTKAFAGHALWDLMYLDSDVNDVLQLATFAAAHITMHSGVTPGMVGSSLTLVEELDRLQRKQLAQVQKALDSGVGSQG